jgi:hypothetical protein
MSSSACAAPPYPQVAFRYLCKARHLVEPMPLAHPCEDYRCHGPRQQTLSHSPSPTQVWHTRALECAPRAARHDSIRPASRHRATLSPLTPACPHGIAPCQRRRTSMVSPATPVPVAGRPWISRQWGAWSRGANPEPFRPTHCGGWAAVALSAVSAGGDSCPCKGRQQGARCHEGRREGGKEGRREGLSRGAEADIDAEVCGHRLPGALVRPGYGAHAPGGECSMSPGESECLLVNCEQGRQLSVNTVGIC